MKLTKLRVYTEVPEPHDGPHDVPWCSDDGCRQYDGKRCKLTGFRPKTFCEPALAELVAEVRELRRQCQPSKAQRIEPLERAPEPCPVCGVDQCGYCHDCSLRNGEGVLHEDCSCALIGEGG